MAFIVSVRYDVSISAPLYKGGERQFSLGLSRCTSSVLKGTLVCAPDLDVHSQSHGWGLVVSPRLSTS